MTTENFDTKMVIKVTTVLAGSILAVFMVHALVVPNNSMGNSNRDSIYFFGSTTTTTTSISTISIPGSEADYGLSTTDFEGFKKFRDHQLKNYKEGFQLRLTDKICRSVEWGVMKDAMKQLLGEEKIEKILKKVETSGDCPSLTKFYGADYEIMQAVKALKASSTEPMAVTEGPVPVTDVEPATTTEAMKATQPLKELSSLRESAVKLVSTAYKGMNRARKSFPMSMDRSIIPNFLTTVECKFYGSADQACTMTTLVGTIFYKGSYQDLCETHLAGMISGANETYYNWYIWEGYEQQIALDLALSDAISNTCYGPEEQTF